MPVDPEVAVAAGAEVGSGSSGGGWLSSQLALGRARLVAQRPITFTWRVPMLCAGSILSAVCYAVTIRAAVGLGPLYAFQDGIARHLHIALGTSLIATAFAFVFVGLAMRTKPGPGTLAQPLIAGFTVDLVLPHIPKIHGLGWRYLAVVVATWMMACGGALMFRAATGVSSYTSVMLGLRRVTGQRLSLLRLGMEFTMFVSGWLLGGVVGWGSVITGVLIGPGIQFWIRRFGGIPGEVAQPKAPVPLA